ncbi:MAG: GAF domain-containing protein [Myxococcales bacterium]|nr:GAF domain-containing protein [Myxococcales bacterium]
MATDPVERVEQLEARLSRQQEQLDGLVRIAENLGRSRDPGKAMRQMVDEISQLLDADRTSIFTLDPGGTLLKGIAVQGETSVEVGVPIGAGIAGLVASRGRAINLKDAYQHHAFDPKFDKLTGYRTRSMLCVPMRNPKREITGVVQVLNKRDGYFTLDDERLLTALASQAAITLEALKLQLRLNISNAELVDASRRLRQKVTELGFLYDNERHLGEAEDEMDLADRVLKLAGQVARCERSAIFLPDENGFGSAWIRGPGDEEGLVPLCRFAVGEGILGKTASHGEVCVLRDEDFERQAMPRELGGDCQYPVRDVVSAPLIDGDEVIGAVAFVNRRQLDRRDDGDDRQLAVLMAAQIARAIARQRSRRSDQQRDRLMTIGRMLSGVLHDLRGPMSIISGYTQLMANEGDAGERAAMAGTIRRKVNEFNDMTREVMAFAKGERSIIVRKVHLSKFTEAVWESLKFEFEERGVAFEVQDESEGIGWFDEAKMQRVVVNIARNARQAMGDTGRFTWIIRDLPGAALRFELVDDGPGIPEGMKDRLFEAFATEGKPGGTGLGLAIVKRIVDDHGGAVAVKSARGQGTRFIIDLPGRASA